MRNLLVEFEIPGKPAPKKNSAQIHYPGIAGMRIQKTPGRWEQQRLARVAQGDSRKPPRTIFGLNEFLAHCADCCDMAAKGNVYAARNAAGLLRRASQIVRPVVSQGSQYQKWHRASISHLRGLHIPTPVAPRGRMLEVSAIFFMGSRQRSDLVNLEQALWDLLEDAEVVTDDGYINHHGASRRDWSDPMNPRVHCFIYDRGDKPSYELPKVRVVGIKDLDDRLPTKVEIEAGGDTLTIFVPPGVSRKVLVMQAEVEWRKETGSNLPGGSVLTITRRSESGSRRQHFPAGDCERSS